MCLGVDIPYPEQWNGCQGLRTVFRFLVCQQVFGFPYQVIQLFRFEACLISFQVGKDPGILLIICAGFRGKCKQEGMRVIQEILPDDIFKVSGCKGLFNFRQRLFIFKPEERIIGKETRWLGPEKAVKAFLRIIPLTELEFHTVDYPFHHLFVKALVNCILHAFSYDRVELILVGLIGVLNNELEDILLVIVRYGADILPDACFLERKPDRSGFLVYKYFAKDIQGHHKRLVRIMADHIIKRQISLVIDVIPGHDRIITREIFHFIERLLVSNGHFISCSRVMGEILFVDERKFFFQRRIPVKEDIRVPGMVIFPVKIQELFVGQPGNSKRITSRFKTIGIIREQVLEDLVAEFPFFWIGVNSFHLIINDAFISQSAVFIKEFIMPSFLLEDARVGIYQRVENSIQVNMHQVEIILVIHAGDRVSCKILGSKGIHKCIERTFYKDIKGAFHGEILTAVQDCVFNDMRCPVIIIRECFKGNGKSLVRIICREFYNLRTAFDMFKEQYISIQLFYKPFLDQLVSGVIYIFSCTHK